MEAVKSWNQPRNEGIATKAKGGHPSTGLSAVNLSTELKLASPFGFAQDRLCRRPYVNPKRALPRQLLRASRCSA